MTYLLTPQERKLLDHLQLEHEIFQVRGELPVGVGKVSLSRLTDLGLLETGPGRWGDTGWRLTENGWRCMYGKPLVELGSEGAPHRHLRIWSWPPTDDRLVSQPSTSSRLTTLPPRLANVSPRVKP